MKPHISKFIVSLSFAAFALPLGAAEPAAGDAFANQLTAQERQDYQSRIKNAGTDAERQKISNEYQEMEQERARLEKGEGRDAQNTNGTQHGKGQAQGNKQGGQSPAVKPGPYGSKNTPQKHGK